VKNIMEQEVETRLSVHEAVCAERYKSIEQSFSRVEDRFDDGSQKMKKLEYLMYAVMVAVLLGPGAAAIFFKKLLGV
jgi:hypothetical protein